MKTDDVLHESKTILVASFALTAALWVKRQVETLGHTKWFNTDLLKGAQPVTPSATTAQTATNTTRFGAGTIYLPGHGRISYRAAIRTRDGHMLYDHDEVLHPCHVGPCPLLRTDVECEECLWVVDAGSYHSGPRCAALVKLEESPNESPLSLTETKRALEHAR